MSPFERGALLLGAALAGAALAGLIARGQWRLTWSFNANLVLVLAVDLLLGGWPGRFFHFWYWILQEAASALCQLGLAVELSARLFGRLPRAHARVGAGLLFIVVALGWAILPLPSQPGDLATVVVPRLAYAEAAAFAWLTGCILWYNVPLHPLHRAVVAGLTPYLVLFSATAHLLHELGWQVVRISSAANVVAFLVVLGYWARVAWAEDQTEETPALAFLQPWRVRR